MKFQKKGDTYLLQLEVGDEIMKSVCEFAREQKIQAASVNAIGAIADPEIGYYNTLSHDYDRQQLQGEFELLGLAGNIAWKGDDPILHAHAIFGSQTGTWGGHLFGAKITATGEFVIRTIPGELARKIDPATRLPLWDLP